MLMTTFILDLNDVTLDCETYGPQDGPLVLCLHGFPDTRHTFRYLAPHLAAKGHRVVVPSMRGYAPSSISKTNNYQLATVANDANRLHELLGGDERAVIIGHDWGAAATYPATAAEPERWHRAITMAVPPLPIMGRSFLSFAQLRSSWYMFYFQSPMATGVVPLNDFDFIAQLWAEWSPSYEASEELAHVRLALASEENLLAALGYYRAMFAGELIDESLAHVQAALFMTPTVPTLYLHGHDDGCVLASSLANVTEHLAPGSKKHIIKDAGHFVHLEQPEAVHRAIDSFLEA
jgi:pimeloyl-ACP methyl ester carboxylesterase